MREVHQSTFHVMIQARAAICTGTSREITCRQPFRSSSVADRLTDQALSSGQTIAIHQGTLAYCLVCSLRGAQKSDMRSRGSGDVRARTRSHLLVVSCSYPGASKHYSQFLTRAELRQPSQLTRPASHRRLPSKNRAPSKWRPVPLSTPRKLQRLQLRRQPR